MSHKLTINIRLTAVFADHDVAGIATAHNESLAIIEALKGCRGPFAVEADTPRLVTTRAKGEPEPDLSPLDIPPKPVAR